MTIRLENVNYVYGEGTAYEIHALKNINLKIENGEFIGLIGHTGSGKSTLIQHLNGLIKATSGTIYYDDENIYREGYSLKELRGKVGLVFQYRCLFWTKESFYVERRGRRKGERGFNGSGIRRGIL